MWTKIPASTNNLLWDFTHLFEKETVFNRSLIFIIGASCMSLLFFPLKRLTPISDEFSFKNQLSSEEHIFNFAG